LRPNKKERGRKIKEKDTPQYGAMIIRKNSAGKWAKGGGVLLPKRGGSERKLGGTESETKGATQKKKR